MIKVENLKIGYRDNLFQSVNFILGNNEKVGLIGLNGTGKSTLLKILANIEKPDQGEVHLIHESIGYLPQEFHLNDEKVSLVGEFLESLVNFKQEEMYRVRKILGKLNWPDIDEFQSLNTLSPGQQMKLYLAKVLIDEPTILLLDEPTNHLDIEGIIWFENFVKNFEGICIIISHDRAFLNNVTNKVFEIDENTIYEFEGNYDGYIIGKEQFKEERERLFKAQERKRKQMEVLLENSRKIKDGKKRGKAVRAAKKRMEREVLSKEINQYVQKSIADISLEGEVRRTKKVLEVKDLAFSYASENSDSRPILKDVDLTIYGNERLWIYGPNGIGKSTLVKIIIDQLKPQSGTVKWGENLVWEYFSQDQSHLPLDKKAIDFFVENTEYDYFSWRKIMEKFLFDENLANLPIAKLSPGQRARLSFAVFAQNRYDCLILDEPTNHLDIRSKEIIEDAFKNYKGAMILISHDRYFVENIGVSKAVTLEEGKLVESI
jgi:ATPase subunit of ABC transporter with duplicated ATPase domains